MTGQSVVPLRAGGQILGIAPQSIEEAFRLAGGISRSGLAPQGMSSPEQVLVAVMTGMELGLPPMFAVQKIAVINGRPALWGDAIPALLYARGFKLVEKMDGAGDKRVAVCQVTRPSGEMIERRFSVEDAKRAGLWQSEARVTRKSRDGSTYQKDNDSPWYRYPERMLQMRARGFAARDGAADVLGGLYLREELEVPARDEPRDITPQTPTALDIPDLTDAPATAEQTALDVPDIEAADETLADPEGFLAKLSEERRYCETEGDVAELRSANADLIARLPPAEKAEADRILEVE